MVSQGFVGTRGFLEAGAHYPLPLSEVNKREQGASVTLGNNGLN